MYESLIIEGSGSGLVVGEGHRPGRAPPDVGRVVAWCLTFAAVLSVAAAASQMAAWSGLKITTRIVEFSLAGLYPVALVLAAAVALSLTDADTRAGAQASRATRWADGALAVCATAVLAAGAYAIAAVLAGSRVGADDFNHADWMSRIGFAGVPIAGGLLGAVALYVVGRSRRGTTSAIGGEDEGLADSGERAIELPSRHLLDAVAASLIVGTVVLVAEVMTSVFPRSSFPQGSGVSAGPGASVGSRIGSVSTGFNTLPIAFAALAVVVLITAAGRRRESRDGFSVVAVWVAAMIGLVAVLAAGYGAWRAATGDVISVGSFDWWSRASGMGTALASGTLGAATGYVNVHSRLAVGVEPARIRTRFDPRIVGLGLAIAALGSADFVVMTVAKDEPGIAIGDLLVMSGSSILTAVGLAFAAAIVVAFSRRASSDPAERDPRRNVVDAIAGAIASATLVTTVFVIVYVLEHKDSTRPPPKFGESFVTAPSLLYQSSTAQKLGYVLLALASGFLATGVLRIIWSSRRPSVDDDEPEDEVPLVDLVP